VNIAVAVTGGGLVAAGMLLGWLITRMARR
jgi:hypothetical protein